MAYEKEASVGGLVRGALDDVRDLFREEVALARAEVRHELSKVSVAGAQFGGAAVALWFAGMFMFTALALGIAALFEWPAWAGFAIMSALLTAAGLLLFMGGRRAVREVRPLPHTIGSIKENFQ